MLKENQTAIRIHEQHGDMLPRVGDIIVYNQICRTGSWGLSRKNVEERGCAKVVNDSHGIFIEIERFESENYSRKSVLYKTDFYVGLTKFKKVDEVYYCGENGLSWEQLDIANF